MKTRTSSKIQCLILLTAVFTLQTGCSIHSITGDTLSSFAVDHTGPYVLGMDDLAMACAEGEAVGYLLMSYERVTDSPDKAALFTLIAAGICTDIQAKEAELDYARHMFAKRPTDAQDARIREKRARQITAKRFHLAYQRLVAAYGEPGEVCPDLPEDEEVLYLLGLAVGVQSLIHDRASGGVVNVDMGLPMKVARATNCLNDQRLWGIPSAVRGGVFAGIPGTAPKGEDPWALMNANATLGDKAGVRLARAILVQAYTFAGRSEEAQQAIVAHGAARSTYPAPKEARLLDAYGNQIVRHFSDLLWIENKGHRTPVGQLGSFWEVEEEEEDDTDFLDGL